MPKISRPDSCNASSLDTEDEATGLLSEGASKRAGSSWQRSWKLLGGLACVGFGCLGLSYAGRGPEKADSRSPQQKYTGLNGATAPLPAVPQKANQHNGIEWTPMVMGGDETMTFFIIGDWGGMDGTVVPENGGDRMVQYNGGMEPGPHVFAHRPSGCPDQQMTLCFNSRGTTGCAANCGYNDTVDREPALLVATHMKKRAKTAHPKFVLNVGDNFYWGGIPLKCGQQPMAGIHYITGHMFDTIFNQIYNTPELNIAWLSVLGNHDYGGWMYAAAWDQQIAYTWHNPKWRLPAQYWMQHVKFPDKEFEIDILLMDSNNEDACDASLRPNTNMCSYAHNNNANCASIGGPASPATCSLYFADLWSEQVKWAEKKLKKSKATWQVIVTHFPCGHQEDWYTKLHKEFGLDLVVTGHTHVQLTRPIGGLMCVISGGGGGILSEVASHGDWSNSYGFYEATIDRYQIKLELINFVGLSLGTWKVHNNHPAPSHHEEVSIAKSMQTRMEKKDEKDEKEDENNHEKKDAGRRHEKDEKNETEKGQQRFVNVFAKEKHPEDAKDQEKDQDEKTAKEDKRNDEKQKKDERKAEKKDERKDEKKDQKKDDQFGQLSHQEKENCGLWCKLLSKRRK